VKKIFSIIEIIAKINGEFLQSLDVRMASWDPNTTKIGDLLSQLTEKLKVYDRYINNYDTTMNAYGMCLQQKPKFADLIARARDLPDVKGLDLLSFLIMPVQRIPRYILLLGDLLKNTPKEHMDYKETENALQKAKEIADFLNEGKRKAENASRVVVIQDSLIGLDEELVKQGRSYVREGMVIKKKKNASDYCHFFLLSDILLYTVQNKKKYKVKHKVPLTALICADIPDTDLLRNAIKLTWGKKNWIVSTNSPTDKKAWMDDFRKAIAESTKKK